MWEKHKNTSGFTIVELLIVIVVIAILAAISIVAYNGIQNRARASAASSALSQVSKRLALLAVDSSTGYPANSMAFYTEIGADNNGTKGDVTYQYSVNNSADPKTYCVTATMGNVSYTVSQNGTPSPGGCAGHGQGGVAAITNLITNPSFETGSAAWSSYYSPSRTQSNEQARYGTYSQKIVTNSDTVGNGLFAVVTKTYVPDTTIRATAWVFAPVNMPFSFAFRSPTQLGNGGWGNTNYVGTGTWQRVEIAYTIPTSPEAWYAPKINTRSGYPPINTVFYVDGVMMTEGDIPGDYKDPTSDSNWAWTSTPHASTSVGP